jgi:hypothetical protein
VLSGGIAREELKAEGAAAVFDDPQQLVEDIRTTSRGNLVAASAVTCNSHTPGDRRSTAAHCSLSGIESTVNLSLVSAA